MGAMQGGQHLVNKHNASLSECLLALWAARVSICTHAYVRLRAHVKGLKAPS